MTQNFYEALFGVRGKVAVVTGGTRGIGLMIAEGLLRAGAKVYISSRKEDACKNAESQLSAYGECIAIPSDLSNLEGCEGLAAEIAAREQRLDILVNNAGLTWNEDVDQFPEKGWDRVVDLDMKGPFFLTQKLLPLLRRAASPEGRASVINVTSVNGLRTGPLRNYSYAAAKAGLGQLSAQLARDLTHDHINVNAIAPGAFKSKMTGPLYATEEVERETLKMLPMGRWGSMENAAGLVIFLSSQAGSFITGQHIPFDGGGSTT